MIKLACWLWGGTITRPSTIGASTSPQQTYIKSNKESLLEECRFFGVEDMAARIRGHTSISDLSPQDRRLKMQEDEVRQSPDVHPEFLVEVFLQDATPLDPTGLGLPILRNPARAQQRPTMKCVSYETFCTRFDRMTGVLAGDLAEVPGIVFAGGSVTGALTEGRVGDIDIFLTCSLAEARSVLERIYAAVQKVDEASSPQQAPIAGKRGRKILVTRSRHAVTIFRIHDGKPAALPVQVILSVYDGVAQMLTGFDIDSCCFAYVPGRGVLCTPRGLRALRYDRNQMSISPYTKSASTISHISSPTIQGEISVQFCMVWCQCLRQRP